MIRPERTFPEIVRYLRLVRGLASSEPNYMVLFATAACNARCEFCFYWEEIESANVKTEISLEEIQKTSKSLNHLFYLSIGGGEPFLRKDLVELVKAFYTNSRTRVVAIATNGAYPERVEAFIDRLSKECPELHMKIQVSVDNLFEKHDLSRKVDGLFKKLNETCKIISSKKKDNIPVILSVGTVITKENKNDLEALKEYLDENVDCDYISLINPRGNAKVEELKEVSLEEYREAKTMFNHVSNVSSFFARIQRAVDRKAKLGVEKYIAVGKKGYPWQCVAGKKLITLSEKGDLYPCEMLGQIAPEMDSKIGNVRDNEYNIINMLSASKAKKLRTYIKQTQCSCSYECAALCNVVYHRRDWPGVLLRTIRFY